MSKKKNRNRQFQNQNIANLHQQKIEKPQVPMLTEEFLIPVDKTEEVLKMFEDSQSTFVYNDKGEPVPSPHKRYILWKFVMEVIGQTMTDESWRIHFPPYPLGQIKIVHSYPKPEGEKYEQH